MSVGVIFKGSRSDSHDVYMTNVGVYMMCSLFTLCPQCITFLELQHVIYSLSLLLFLVFSFISIFIHNGAQEMS